MPQAHSWVHVESDSQGGVEQGERDPQLGTRWPVAGGGWEDPIQSVWREHSPWFGTPGLQAVTESVSVV